MTSPASTARFAGDVHIIGGAATDVTPRPSHLRRKPARERRSHRLTSAHVSLLRDGAALTSLHVSRISAGSFQADAPTAIDVTACHSHLRRKRARKHRSRDSHHPMSIPLAPEARLTSPHVNRTSAASSKAGAPTAIDITACESPRARSRDSRHPRSIGRPRARSRQSRRRRLTSPHVHRTCRAMIRRLRETFFLLHPSQRHDQRRSADPRSSHRNARTR